MRVTVDRMMSRLDNPVFAVTTIDRTESRSARNCLPFT